MPVSREKLSGSEIHAALESLPGWTVADHTRLVREYRFADFTRAFAFMAGAATIIQQLDHHPEWSNIYGTVRVQLWTHTAGGITPMDIELASRMESLAQKLL